MRDFNKTIELRAETINQLDAAIQGQEARATQYAEKVKDAGSLLAASHDVLREKLQAAKDETRQDATKHKENKNTRKQSYGTVRIDRYAMILQP